MGADESKPDDLEADAIEEGEKTYDLDLYSLCVINNYEENRKHFSA